LTAPSARAVLAVAALALALAAAARWRVHRGALALQERIWLGIAAVFAVLSALSFGCGS
jgi:hypothetical protein